MKFIKIRDVKSPSRGTDKSAGIDFYVPNDQETIVLKSNDSVLFPTGIKMNIPQDHVLIAFNKSGVATKRNLTVGASVVDEDYQGEIHIHLTNVGEETQVIKAGEKIIQFLLMPIVYEGLHEVMSEDELWEGEVTERGEGGFGSTGIH
jgi:dUTP pyrophosphatase